MDKRSMVIRLLLITALLVLSALSYYYLMYPKPFLCMPCGNMGYSHTLTASFERGTFVREYKGFKVLTDSLSHLVLNDKTFFLEKKFRYGLTNAS